MKRLAILLVIGGNLFILSSFNQSNALVLRALVPHEIHHKQNRGDQAIAKIAKIPKVAKMDSALKTERGQETGLQYRVRKQPGDSFSYYWIQVGELRQDRFETILNFYLEKSLKKIYYYDPLKDEKVNLSTWEKL